jgi:hypothetical protein
VHLPHSGNNLRQRRAVVTELSRTVAALTVDF